MRKTPVLAAVSATLLAFVVPTYGNEGATQKIKDEQYSNFVSGASFCTGVWTNANETWSESGGLDPRYWSGTAGASVVDVFDRAQDGSLYYEDSDVLWTVRQQPPVYGHVNDNQEYQPLYSSEEASRPHLVDIDTSTAAPVVCRFAEEGDVAAEIGGDIFFDANVTLEAFAYGEANRPDDSVLAPDAKLAIYIQDTTPAGDPRFFIVARDWKTGAVQHYLVNGGGIHRWLYEYDKWFPGPRYSGRIIVRAVRNVHNTGKFDVTPAFLVYLDDGSYPLYWYSYGIGNPPYAVGVEWDKIRDDLGNLQTDNANPLFQSLTPVTDMSLSKVSYSGGVRLGAYAVGTADPMRTAVKWAADSSMIRLLNVDGEEIDGLRWTGSEYEYQGAEKVDAGSYTYYRELERELHYRRLSVSWRGVNGWSDGSYTIDTGNGCEVSLGTNCFSEGRASLDTMPDDEERAAELEESLPVRTGKRIGNRYIEVSDALAHAAVLGGTVRFLAYPMSTLAITQMTENVELDLTGEDFAVPYDALYAEAIGLIRHGEWGSAIHAGDVDGSISASAAYGHSPTLTLRGGSTSRSYTPVYGQLYVTNTALSAKYVTFSGSQYLEASKSHIHNSPRAVLEDVGFWSGGLVSTGSDLSLIRTYMAAYDSYDTTNTLLHVHGGSLAAHELSVQGGVRVTAAMPVTVSGGNTYGVFEAQTDVLDSTNVTLTTMRFDGAVTASNSVNVVLDSVNAQGGVWLSDVADACITGSVWSGGTRIAGGLHVHRSTVDIAPNTAIDSLELYNSIVPQYSWSIGSLVVSNDAQDVTIGGTLQVTNNTMVRVRGAVSVAGGTFAGVVFDHCGPVSVSNSTMAATTFDHCGPVSVSNSTMAATTFDHCGPVSVSNSTMAATTFDHCGPVSVCGTTFADVTLNCITSTWHSGGASRVNVRDGMVSVYDGLIPTIQVTNSIISVYGGTFSTARNSHNSMIDYQTRTGSFSVLDSNCSISGGLFGSLGVSGCSHINITGGKFYQNTDISVTTACVISGGQFGDDALFPWRDDWVMYAPHGDVRIISDTSVTLTGDAWFARDVFIKAPKVRISSGRFGVPKEAIISGDTFRVVNMSSLDIRSADAIISGGTFHVVIPVMSSEPRIVITGGRFDFDVSYNEQVIIPPGKRVLKRGDGYYHVVDW